ncbi:MAG: hypothetical protein II882_10305 [Lachnospiraceae bacterium]|nr:hypothetical protein [Lachnospiraceae bacterium]
MKLVLAGSVGLCGVLREAEKPENAALLRQIFPARFLAHWEKDAAAQLAAERPCDAEIREDLSEGVFAALWRLGEKAGCGFTVRMEALALSPYTTEIAEALDLDPYLLPGSGYAALREEPGAGERVIGETTPGAARVVESGDRKRYLVPPERTVKDR